MYCPEEGKCPLRGRVSFRVYMSQKSSKYDMTLLILAESRCTILNWIAVLLE
jgi:hypothetical protein